MFEGIILLESVCSSSLTLEDTVRSYFPVRGLCLGRGSRGKRKGFSGGAARGTDHKGEDNQCTGSQEAGQP